MRTSLPMMLVALLCLWLPAIAQQTTFSGIRPAELVESAKSARAPFAEYDQLFTSSNGRGRPQADFRIDNYTILDVNEELRSQIMHEAPEALRLLLPSAGRAPLELELVRVHILDPEFAVIESGTDEPVEVKTGVHYRGVIAGERGSIAAVSVQDGEISGLISSPTQGNLVLGRLPEDEVRPEVSSYILYNDEHIFETYGFECGTDDTTVPYTDEELRDQTGGGRGAAGCVRVYFEVDNDIFKQKGGTAAATSYVTALFNQVATLYANESVSIAISEIFVWSTTSPYTGSSSSSLLSQFQNYRSSINGDIGQLLSYKASGGIAVLSGLCRPYTSAKLSFSSIGTSFANVPTYSFTTMVVAHELGHLLGSHHTHACVWNGNGTAIDGCAGGTEGGCPNPGVPSGGGTIMSYCHITSTGINYSKGFGPQPGNVIRNKIAAASCLTGTCPIAGDGGSSGGDSGSGDSGGGSNPPPTGCSGEQVILRLVLDTYAPETTWEIKDASGKILHKGGPYAKNQANKVMLDTFCLAQACYTFTIKDAYNDGICCNYGSGSYSLRNKAGTVLASGSSFTNLEQTNFCTNGSSGGDSGSGDDSGNCLSINFNEHPIRSFGLNQDAGTYEIQNGGKDLFIRNNAWKAIALDYTITSNTILEFEFKANIMGEVHGIGFDHDDGISSAYTFQLWGFQNWGIVKYRDYPGDGQWKKYRIEVGKHYYGQATRLFFTADHDSGNRNGNAYFRNVRIYEGAACQSLDEGGSGPEKPGPQESSTVMSSYIYPNPAETALQLELSAPVAGAGRWTVVSVTGQEIRTAEAKVHKGRNQYSIPVEDLAPGMYLLRWRDESGEQVHRFTKS